MCLLSERRKKKVEPSGKALSVLGASSWQPMWSEDLNLPFGSLQSGLPGHNYFTPNTMSILQRILRITNN